MTDRVFRSLSLGAGQQSTALAIACVLGLEVADGGVRYSFPSVDRIAFADTGNEMPQTYDHLDRFGGWLRERGHELHVVRATERRGENSRGFGGLAQRVADRASGLAPGSPGIPHFSRDEDGVQVRSRQHCTWDFKSVPLDRATKRAADGRPVEVLIGYSLEESHRMAEARSHWPNGWRFRYPLIEARVRRAWSVAVCEEHLGYAPTSSACWHCPHRPATGMGSFAEIRDTDPETWRKVIEFDRVIRDGTKRGLRGDWFLTRHCLPIEEAVREAERQGTFEWPGEDAACVGGCWT